MTQQEVLLAVDGLKRYFPVRTGWLERLASREQRFVKAVDGVDFQICSGDIFALVGESGCGKTTTGKLLTLLETPTGGSIFFRGSNVTKMRGPQLKGFRREVQMIFQDPYDSLNPRLTAMTTVSEPLLVHHLASSEKERVRLVSDVLERVGLEPARDFLHRYPHELSGGQRQRIAIARAMVLHPTFVVADEPVSMLDVSVRAGVLEMMLRLREELNATYLCITHDLAVARYMSNKMAIMYLGRIVEMGDAEELVGEPRHPYAKLLMAAVPNPDPSIKREHLDTRSEVPNPAEAPSGCTFHPRCPNSRTICSDKCPQLTEVREGHFVACHDA